MARYTLYPIIGTLLLTVFSSLSGAINLECGIYEQEVECVDICNICDENRPCPKTHCVPGCDCIPGFSRNNLGNCIPRQNCDEDNFGVFKQSVPASGVDKRGNLLGISDGCPVEEFCVVSCKKRNFENGVCEGPGNAYCNCFSGSLSKKIGADDEPAKDPNAHGCPKKPHKCLEYCRKNHYKTSMCVRDIVTDPTKVKYICRCLNCTPGVDGCPKGDEAISPQIVDGEPAKAPNDHGCPNNVVACVDYCVSTSQRKKNGMCVGNQCQCCTPGVGQCSQIDASGVDKRGNLLGISDGCPVAEFCVVSCKKRGFENGVCGGPGNGYCNCFSGLFSGKTPAQIGADDVPAQDPNEEECRKTCDNVCRFLSNGHQIGICVGKKCKCCTPGVGCRRNAASGVDKRGNLLGISDGCPVAEFCVVSCKKRGFENGVCGGPGNEYCNCFSGLFSGKTPAQIGADDEPAQDPNEEECRKTCDNVCRFLSNGHQIGICVGKKCKCCTPGVGCRRNAGEISAQNIFGDNFGLSQILADNGCPKDPHKCDRHCRSGGYLFGICDGEGKKYCLCV